MIYAERIVAGLRRFYSGHFQNTPNIKTFIGYAIFNLLGLFLTQLMRVINIHVQLNNNPISFDSVKLCNNQINYS